MGNSKVQSLEEISGGQMAALISGICIEIPRRGHLGLVKSMIANTKRMKPILRALVEKPNEVALRTEEALTHWHEGWPKFWRAFGFKYDHNSLFLPEYRSGFAWSVVTPDLSTWPASRLLREVCGRMFPVWSSYSDSELDKIVSAAEPTSSYVMLVRDTIEADDVHRNKSTRKIEADKIPAITLRQRTVLEARYFMETACHLDLSNATICAGSRYSDGNVPFANWIVDKFWVSYVYPDYSCDYWRVREVVSY